MTSLMMVELHLGIGNPDAIIRPKVYQHSMLDGVDPHEIILMGEKATSEALDQIKNSLSWYKRVSRRFQQAEPPGKLFVDGRKTEQVP